MMIGVFTLLAVTAAYGQGVGLLKGDIPFQFTAQGKVYPGGQCEFLRDEQAKTFKVLCPNKTSGQAMIVTRLAGAMHTTPKDAHLVFDKIDDAYFLSEIWFSEGDGYLLYGTQAKHTHRVVDIPR
jgi:hypothetical protein